jgi:hypothetical protein
LQNCFKNCFRSPWATILWQYNTLWYFTMFKACHSRDSPTTLCYIWFSWQRCHIINSKGNFERICSITNAFIKGAIIKALGILWVFHGYRHSKTIYFKNFFNHPPIKVLKKSQPLVQHVKNDHSKRRNMFECFFPWAKCETRILKHT